MKKSTWIILAVSLVCIIIILTLVSVPKSSNGEDNKEIVTKGCGDGTVVYLNEELCWQQGTNPNRVANWQESKNYCDNLILGKNNDWRLPTAEELKSIVDSSYPEIVINPKYFKDTQGIHYWTSSEYKSGVHWYIHFEIGYQGFALDATKDFGVRCVRENTLF